MKERHEREEREYERHCTLEDNFLGAVVVTAEGNSSAKGGQLGCF